jgi:chromosome segregation ATPase
MSGLSNGLSSEYAGGDDHDDVTGLDYDDVTAYDGGEEWHEAHHTEDENDEDEDDEEMEILHADHPALARVQAALKRQLTRRKTEVDAELRELKAKAKEKAAERETVGVQLYNAQQQLAKLQTQLEAANDGCSEAMAKRTQLDASVAAVRKEHEASQAVLRQRQDEADAAQVEYDRLSGQVLMLERHADELASKVKGARRAASKVSQLQDEREEKKQQQDLYVDRLNEKMKELERDISIAKKQREAQSSETKAALDALREAQAEVEDIAIRRREINTLWQQSTAGLAKRNDALSEIQQTVAREQQELFAKEREVENTERRIRDEQETHETLSSQLSRLQTELGSVQKKLEMTYAEQEKLKREYSMITKAMQETEEQLQRVRQQVNICSSELNIARDKVDRLSNQKVRVVGGCGGPFFVCGFWGFESTDVISNHLDPSSICFYTLSLSLSLPPPTSLTPYPPPDRPGEQPRVADAGQADGRPCGAGHGQTHLGAAQAHCRPGGRAGAGGEPRGAQQRRGLRP